MQKHNNDTITTSGHSSLEKYTSHFIRKGYESFYCVRGELETEQNCNILTPQLFRLLQHFFPVLLGCSTEGLGAQPLLRHGSHSSIFSPTDLNFLSPGLYNNLTSTYFLRASQFTLNSTRRQSRLSPDIFDRMHLLFTQVHFLFWQLGRGPICNTTRLLFYEVFKSLFWCVNTVFNTGKSFSSFFSWHI